MNIKPLLLLTIIGIAIVFGKSSKSKLIKIKLQKKDTTKTSTGKYFENKISFTTKERLQLLYGSLMYSGYIYIGTPGQPLTVVFDTGSTDLWVGSSCLCEKFQEYCDSYNYFDNSKSKTYRKDGRRAEIKYPGSHIEGVVGQDVVSFAGLEVKDQLFIEACKLDERSLHAHYEGIMGLSFTSDSEIPADNAIFNLIKQKIIEPVFAFYLSRDDYVDSELALGGIDKRHYTDEFVFTPVITGKHWNISLNAIKVGDRQVVGQYYAVVDSGTSLIIAQSDVIDPINTAIGAKFNDKMGLYMVDCEKKDTLPTVYIVVNNKPLPMKPDEYILYNVDENYNTVCISGFAKVPKVPLVLGIIFMQIYYTQFDVEHNRIGFARAV